MEEPKREISDIVREGNQNKGTLQNIDLMWVPHRDKGLLCTGFGGHFYDEAIQEMNKHYWYSDVYPDVTFRPATTSESVSIAEHFTQIDPSFIRNFPIKFGLITLLSEGAYINPPSESILGEDIDEKSLRQLRDKSRKVNGIWLGDEDFAFVPYETFDERYSSADALATSGLARGLEHTEGMAHKIQKLSSCTQFNSFAIGVDKERYEQYYHPGPKNRPVTRVVETFQNKPLNSICLSCSSSEFEGYAFGVTSLQEPLSKKGFSLKREVWRGFAGSTNSNRYYTEKNKKR